MNMFFSLFTVSLKSAIHPVLLPHQPSEHSTRQSSAHLSLVPTSYSPPVPCFFLGYFRTHGPSGGAANKCDLEHLRAVKKETATGPPRPPSLRLFFLPPSPRPTFLHIILTAHNPSNILIFFHGVLLFCPNTIRFSPLPHPLTFFFNIDCNLYCL